VESPVDKGTEPAYLLYLNTNAPYEHDYVTPYHLEAVWHVQSLLYECTFVSHFIALATRL